MKQLLPCLLLGLAGSLPAHAQTTSTEVAPDSTTLIKGFALGYITEPNGQTHQVYVPVEPTGFSRVLPFYRRAGEVRRLGQPWTISLDKVQKMRLHGVYYEHLRLRGKDTHLLASRVAAGPVELFSYLEPTALMVPAGSGAGPILVDGLPNQHWYLRRNGELLKVLRLEFVSQLSAYFQDDPATVAAITQRELHYRDLPALVQAYNQRQLASGPAK